MKLDKLFFLYAFFILLVMSCDKAEENKSTQDDYYESDNIKKPKAPEGKIYFSDMIWSISEGEINHHNKSFLVKSENIEVDKDDFLHLQVSEENGKIYGSEIICDSTLNMGEFVFYLASEFVKMPDNVILKLSAFNPADPSDQIGITFCKNKNKNNINPITYYIVKDNNEYNHYVSSKKEIQGMYSTHKFYLKSAEYGFASYEDHGNPTNSIIEETMIALEEDDDFTYSEQIKYTELFDNCNIKISLLVNENFDKSKLSKDGLTFSISKFKYFPFSDN